VNTHNRLRTIYVERQTMLDIRFVRENPEAFAEAMKNRNFPWDGERFAQLDESRRAAIAAEEELLAKRNAASRRIGALMKEGAKEEAEAAKAEVAALKDEIAKRGEEREAAEAALNEILMSTPNPTHPTTPVGASEDDNPEVRRWGTPPTFDFDFKAHWDLGPELGIIDFDRGVKLAHSRFYVLGGLGARLERSLINFMADTHTSRGFKEWWVPAIANAETLTGTAQLPKFEEDLFKTTDGMYLIPTAEVQLTNLHRDEVIDGAKLPLKYCAFTPCFRSEAGSAGRDTRGIIRVHQFSKVEMVKFTRPEDSQQELELMVNDAENILQLLGLPYRVISLCTGDIGFSSCKTYDLEVWLPSYGAYKEISSCSDCWDFQARRANIKYRDPDAFKGSRYVHTLNGSGLAVGRTMAAIIENYQQADGSVKVPEVLVPYMGVEYIKPEEL
jgi:seryl-tRNA synthetase